MIVAALIIFGLIFGSFVNAMVWRLHEQAIETAKKRPSKKYLELLSMTKGRSMCSRCHHPLSIKDLVPILSYLQLRGKCRYCHEPIADPPIIELAMPLLFVLTYVFWPVQLEGYHMAIFILWLLELVGLTALAVYDLRWMLLPNRILYPLFVLAAGQVAFAAIYDAHPGRLLLNVLFATLVGGGLFYVLFQVSHGAWIGGGDVKLGWLLGLTAGMAAESTLLIFVAALGGTVIAVPFLASGKLQQKSVIPFGPLLIVGGIIVRLFGLSIISWYEHLLRFGT